MKKKYLNSVDWIYLFMYLFILTASVPQDFPPPSVVQPNTE